MYLNSLGNLFTNWDDSMIYANPQIKSLDWRNILEIFTLREGATYQPIRMVSYAIDYHFWKLNPLGYHITNIFFYILTCIMVLFHSLTPFNALKGESFFGFSFTCGLFGSASICRPSCARGGGDLALSPKGSSSGFFLLSCFLSVSEREGEGRGTENHFSRSGSCCYSPCHSFKAFCSCIPCSSSHLRDRFKKRSMDRFCKEILVFPHPLNIHVIDFHYHCNQK